MGRRALRPPVASGHRRLQRARAASGFAVCWALIGLAVGAMLLTTGGEHAKIRVMTVLTGSMRPTLGVGDVVMAEVVPASQIRSGDIVTYREPTGKRYVTHRVQSIVWTGDLASVVTRGDANEIGETWTVRGDGAIGRVKLHVSHVGYVIGALGSAQGRLVIVGVAAVLGVYAMLLIWRPRREDMTARVRELLEQLTPPPAPAPTPPPAHALAPADDEARELTGEELLSLGELLPRGADAPREEELVGGAR